MRENSGNHDAAPQLTTHECKELDVWSAEVGWDLGYRQVGKGQFDAWFNMNLCSQLRAVDQYCNRETLVSGSPPPNHVAILIPTNQGSRGILQGKLLKSHEVAISTPGSETTYRSPADLRILSLHVPVDRLREGFRAIAQTDLDHLIGETRVIELPDESLQRLTAIGRHVASAAEFAAGKASETYQKELEEHFVVALVRGFVGDREAEPGLLSRQNRVRYVLAARDYIESHLGEPLGIETLARVTGVSPRTLEYAFREVFDVTPIRYIKTRRLDAARRRFLTAEDPRLKVTDVALDYGFQHFSHFSRDYHAMFGEYPSQTLRTDS